MADQKFDLSSDCFLVKLSPEISGRRAIGRVLPITIFITMPWTCRQLGVKSVFAAERSLYHKPILSTNVVARRQRNGFPALWTKLKRSGSPRSVEKWK